MRLRHLLCTACWLLTASLCAQQRHGDGLDDVLQHVPMASVVVLHVAGVGSHSWPDVLGTAAASYVLSAGVTYGLKHVVRERRPDGTDHRSFPSGHATLAFAGATTLRHEFGRQSSWIVVGGYAIAAATAADRVRRDRHHWHDVCAGAAIGMLSTELTYYLKDRRHRRPAARRSSTDDRLALSVAPHGLTLSLNW